MLYLKSLKWCLGITLFLGLTACMEMQRSEQTGTEHHEQMNMQPKQTTANQSKVAQKSYPSKDPTQQATPGPARKAAPQLPVIQ